MPDSRHPKETCGDVGTRIAVVSEIRLYRDGLARVLSDLDDVSDVQAYETALSCVTMSRDLPPHVVLLDMSTTDGAASARLLSRELSSTRIVALAVPETEPHVVACVEAGVSGYVPRSGSIDDLVAAIRCALRSEAVCSPVITWGLMRRITALANAGARQRLTARELEIAGYIELGLSNREIASRLGVELCTVKNHVHHMLEKLGVNRRADIADCIHA